MRLYRVYLPTLQEGEAQLSGREAHHLSRVLRVQSGQKVLAFDGAGLEAEGEVASVSESEVRLNLNTPRPSLREADVEVTLAVALLKGDKMSDIVRQATELGAARFIPILTERCDVPVLSNNKLQRWRRVAQEASKQSGRSVVPEVTAPVKLTELEPDGVGLVADPRASATLKELKLEAAERLTVVTGPEGGLSPHEVDLLGARGFKAVRLGSRILRAETAPVAVLSALLLPEAR